MSANPVHLILGATGHIGSVLAHELLQKGERVTVVLRDAKKSPDWERQGAHVAMADVRYVDALREAFRQGNRLFLLNPPADPSTDTVTEERHTLSCILEALEGSGIEKIVAQSTYGAQPGERIGDLGVLYEMEQALNAGPIPATYIRAAYYMSNWDAALETAQKEGKVHTFYPADFKLPMVAPHDIGLFAAQLMMEPVESTGLRTIEGPQTYSSEDVAMAFSEVLNRPVEAIETPRENWIEALKALGFSEKAAESFANMNAVTLESQNLTPEAPVRGQTTLRDYIRDLANH